ncbi:class E sortase [Streptomyces griseosporeus]
MRRVIHTAGTVLIVVGLLLVAFAAFQNWQRDREYGRAQRALHADLSEPQAGHEAPAVTGRTPRADPAPRKQSAPPEGAALAVLRIPRFGAGYQPVIVEGVSQSDLAKGPGHYPGTAMPGEVGNFAVAGHRTGWGQPFNRLDELVRGDRIVVEWRGRMFTYHVTGSRTVKPTDVEVIAPVPDKPGAKPDKARITLTTCTDRDPVSRDYVHRLIVWGELDGQGR